MYKNLIILLLCSWFVDVFSQYDSATIYTPIGGNPVPDTWVFTGTDFDLSWWERRALKKDLKDNYGNAELIEDPSYKYNCHAYAWHVSEGGNKVWIGRYSSSAENVYWTNESYIEVPTESQASKVNYHEDGNHSAVTTSTSGWFRSKWGNGGLVYHRWDNVPSIYRPDLGLKYYKLCFDKLENKIISSDYTKNGCRFLMKNITINNNVDINISTEDWFKIEGTFDAPLGSTLNITPN